MQGGSIVTASSPLTIGETGKKCLRRTPIGQWKARKGKGNPGCVVSLDTEDVTSLERVELWSETLQAVTHGEK